MTVITAWNLFCKTDLHLLSALACKTFPCKSMNKCPQNKTLPLDSPLGKTSRAKTVVLPRGLEKGHDVLGGKPEAFAFPYWRSFSPFGYTADALKDKCSTDK